MSSLELDGRYAARVRIEITTNDGAAYEIELENCAKTDLGIERDSVEMPADGPGSWAQTIGLDTATVTLTAHGKVTKAERRG